MNRLFAVAFALAILLAFSAGSVSAHHSFAATYLEGQTQKIEGKVVQFLFRNPHSFLHVEAPDEKGFTTTQYPVIAIKNGGSIQGLIDAMNAILDKTVYKHEEEGGTLIIPGRGRICDEYEVGEYRDMIAIIRDRVQAMINQGATVEQVKTARLTTDFDARYGAVSGPWTTDMFVEAVYTSLKQGRPKPNATK